MSKHRPGPWRYDRRGQLLDANEWFVGDIEDDADGWLAAAAPEMLAALCALYEDGRTRLSGPAWRMVRAAIDKAEGRNK